MLVRGARYQGSFSGIDFPGSQEQLVDASLRVVFFCSSSVSVEADRQHVRNATALDDEVCYQKLYHNLIMPRS